MVDSINYDVKECMRDLYPENRWGLLTILMLFANAQRRCWPSIDGLAHLMHTSQRKVTKARDWLIEHGALSLVPYDKRVEEETKLPPRQLIYQLTGSVIIDDKRYAYLYADVSGGGNIKVSAVKNTAVKNTDGGNGTKNRNPIELQSNEVKETPQPKPVAGALITQGDKVLGRVGDPLTPEQQALIHKPDSVQAFEKALEEKEKVPPKRKVTKNVPPSPVVDAGQGKFIGPFKNMAAAKRHTDAHGGSITDLSAVPPGVKVSAPPEPEPDLETKLMLFAILRTTGLDYRMVKAVRDKAVIYRRNGYTAEDVVKAHERCTKTDWRWTDPKRGNPGKRMTLQDLTDYLGTVRISTNEFQYDPEMELDKILRRVRATGDFAAVDPNYLPSPDDDHPALLAGDTPLIEAATA